MNDYSRKRIKNVYNKFPESPGVYIMKDARGRILYVGKAGNLRRRVSSYFQKAHEYRTEELVRSIKKIDYKKTDTAIEALILEAELIKKYKPPFNVREKDDKSFLYVEITKEKFPRVLLVRGKSVAQGKRFGPFTSASSIRAALKILRRIFPYSTHLVAAEASEASRSFKGRPCFDYQIGLCPGTCIGAISRADYLKNIRNLKLFFSERKKEILRLLKKEMREASRRLDFERAEKTRRKIFALQHIQDVAVLGDSDIIQGSVGRTVRIEGYDISNISGTSAVGSMVVFHNNEPAKAEYRKFRIRTIKESNDVGMLREVLRRRFRHVAADGGWPLPDLILVDGGAGQVNAVRAVLEEAGIKIPVVGIAKGPERKRNDIVGEIPPFAKLETLIKVRDEAHRFAIKYHKELRGRALLGKV